MGAMWNGNINIKYAAQICTTTVSVHHWKGAVTLLWFYWIYIMVSVTCLTRSVVYHVYTYEYIFVSLLVLNSIVLSFQFLSVLFSDLEKCSQYLIFCDFLNIFMTFTIQRFFHLMISKFVKRYYLFVTWNIAHIYSISWVNMYQYVKQFSLHDVAEYFSWLFNF